MRTDFRSVALGGGLLAVLLLMGGCGESITAKGADTPEGVVDALVKVVETGDTAGYKQLIVHSPTHVEAFEQLPALRIALEPSVSREQAEKDFVTNWVGMVTEFSKHPNKKFTTITGDSATVVVGALYKTEMPSYTEVECKKIDGQWYLVKTSVVMDAAEQEKKYPLDSLKKAAEPAPDGATDKKDDAPGDE